MKKTIICISAVVLVLLILSLNVIFLISLVRRLNLTTFFSDWEVETDKPALLTSFENQIKCNSIDINLESIIPAGRVYDIFGVKDDTIYFYYETRNEQGNYIAHLASVAVAGEDFREIYNWVLSTESRYIKFSDTNDRSCPLGGLYENGCIYLHGDDKTIRYDIQTGEIDESAEIPACHYTWSIEDKQKILIENSETGVTREITLERMAQSNDYANRLLQLSEKNKDKSPTRELFVGVKIYGDDIYLMCEVSSLLWSEYAVFFKYDFDSDCVKHAGTFKMVARHYYNHDMAPRIQ